MDSIFFQEGFQGSQFFIRDEGHGNAQSSHSPGSSRTVGIRFVVCRIVIVDDMADVAKVETATRHIGGDHKHNLVASKTVEDGSPLRLLQTSVDIFKGVKLSLKISQKFLSVMSGVTKDDGLGNLLCLKIFEQGIQPIAPAHDPELMNEALGRYLFLIQFDPHGIFQVGPDEAIDLIGQGGGEEQRLMIMNETGQDEVYVFKETHVQHFVCFIQGQGANLREVDEGAMVKKINQSSGGGDENMNAIA
jgi:hypothetical protein